jgi:glutaredoxin 3
VSSGRRGYPEGVLELYQAEWCPHSGKVRQRLTELGVDFVARQVEAEPEDRDALRERTGFEELPVLVLEDGRAIEGDDEILRFLDSAYDEAPDADAHRAKAHEKAGLPS